MQAPRLGHDARVRGIDAVDVSIDVAALGMDVLAADRDGGGVGASPPQGGNAPWPGATPWETGHHRDLACFQRLFHFARRHAFDAG